jgi:hypothetical protein
VEQELLTLPEHLSAPPIFTSVRVTRSLVLYVCLVDGCLSFCTFSFGHCVVCSSSIYRFWLPLWYLQTLLRPLVSCGLTLKLRSCVNYKKGCTRLAAASDKVYQLLAHGRWFSPGIPVSSTTKTGRQDIAEILLKVALNTRKHVHV